MIIEVSYKEEILALLKEGMWAEQIARKLGLDKEVVYAEIENITAEIEQERLLKKKER